MFSVIVCQAIAISNSAMIHKHQTDHQPPRETLKNRPVSFYVIWSLNSQGLTVKMGRFLFSPNIF